MQHDRGGFHRWIGDDLELRVHVAPGARASKVQGLHGDSLKVRLRARPVEGAANSALLELVADALQVPRSRCLLLSGERNRDKRILVQRPAREHAEAVLRAWLQAPTSS
jgi:uncharacterized protein (TIGR00251 family)